MGGSTEVQLLLNEARYHRNISCKDKKAIKICDKILKIDPNNRDAMLIKAGALEACYRLDEARKLREDIIKKWPNHWEAYYLSAKNCFSIEEDEKALELINKSIDLNENFDNIIIKAQMLYLMGKDNHMEFVEKAEKIDKKRTDNFMKNHWIYDMGNVKPASGGWFWPLKALMRFRKQENKIKELNDSKPEDKNREKADMAPVIGWVVQSKELTKYLDPLVKKYFPHKLEISDINYAMLLDAFIFDYKIPTDGKTPFELYLEKLDLSPSEKGDYEKLLENVFSAFEILDVELGKGMKLYDIINGKTYYVKEKNGTLGAKVGNMVECRIAKIGDSFRIIGPGGFNWPSEIAYSLKRIYNERILRDNKISPFDMLDIVLKIKDKPDTIEGITKDLKKRLKNLGIKLNLNELDKRVNENTDPAKAFPEIFEFNFSSMEDFEETVDIVNKLWNLYPRKEFDGKSPSEIGEYGPKEMMLIRSLISEGAAKIDPNKYPSTNKAVKAMENFKEKWLNAPQKELNGRTPREVILKERAELGNTRKEISFQIQLNKINDFDANKAEKLYFDALAAHKKGNYEESIKLLKEVVEVYPENYKAWGNMGASYASLGRKEDAIRCLEKALSINPKYKLAKGNLKSAKDMDSEPNEKEILELAIEFESKKDYAQAKKCIEEALAFYPNSYHALFLKYRINKKIGETNLVDLKLAFEKARKQNASKEVLELMKDELNELNGIDKEIDLTKFKKLTEKCEQFNKNHQKENCMLGKPIKDYGTPALTHNFFENNPIKLFSAASIGYNLLLNAELERKTIRKIYLSLPSPRKSRVDKEKKRIQEARDADELLEIIKQGIDPLNENMVIENAIKFEDEIIPKLIDIFKTSSNDLLIEQIVKLIYHCNNDNSKQLLDALPSIKDAYNLSMICLLLGLIGNKEVMKPLWDCYHFLNAEYPTKDFDQGPLLALYELHKKGSDRYRELR